MSSLDHSIRARHDRLRNSDAELLCDFEIDNQLQLGGLFDRQLASARTSEDPVDEIPEASKTLFEIWSVGHEPTMSYLAHSMNAMGGWSRKVDQNDGS